MPQPSITNAPPAPSRLWTVQNVAEYLQVSESWVRLHVRLGDLPYCRVGGLLRFIPGDVEAYARGAAVRIADVIPLRNKGL